MGFYLIGNFSLFEKKFIFSQLHLLPSVEVQILLYLKFEKETDLDYKEFHSWDLISDAKSHMAKDYYVPWFRSAIDCALA